MQAPSNPRIIDDKLAWDIPGAALETLTGFNIRTPDGHTITVGATVRRYAISKLNLAPGTHIVKIRARGAPGDVSAYVDFPAITIREAPTVRGICADYTLATPRAEWNVNAGAVTSFSIKANGVEIIQGGPSASSAPLPSLGNGATTFRVEAKNGSAVGASAQVSVTLPSTARSCSATAAGVFTVNNATNTILDPSGAPIKLRGYRMGQGVALRGNGLTQAAIAQWQDHATGDLAGNCQGLEIWWSRGVLDGPGEPDPRKPGVYNTDKITPLKNAIKALKAKGIWVVPSIRVAYQQEGSGAGVVATGWASHADVVNNTPVIRDNINYGKHRDRFFAWIEWLVGELVADPDVASNIAYWEMWHYFGHRQKSVPIDRYIDEFLPAMIKTYRKKEPSRLLGVGFVMDGVVQRIIARTNIANPTWTPAVLDDDNLIYIVAGYGMLRMMFTWDEKTGGATAPIKNFPVDSNNPTWVPGARGIYPGGKFNIEILKEIFDAKFGGITFHEQEGPGLVNWWRRNPIPAHARQWVVGMLNLYNTLTNGFGFHWWPASGADREGGGRDAMPPGNVWNETDIFNLLRKALKGETLS